MTWEALWFDVVFQYYTTNAPERGRPELLWFDVVFQYYTTQMLPSRECDGCGLM